MFVQSFARVVVRSVIVAALVGVVASGQEARIGPVAAQDGSEGADPTASPAAQPAGPLPAPRTYHRPGRRPDRWSRRRSSLISRSRTCRTRVLPGSVPDDRQILLGGVGSDLWHGPGDPPDELWMVTDRGPPGEDDNGKDRQAFAIPEYTPMMLHVGSAPRTAPSVEVLEAIPIVGQSGRPVTGSAQPRRPRRAPGRLSGEGEAAVQPERARPGGAGADAERRLLGRRRVRPVAGPPGCRRHGR